MCQLHCKVQTKMKFLCQLSLLILLLHPCVAMAETEKTLMYSNSMLGMVKLLAMEDRLRHNLATYIQAMQTKLDALKLFQQMLHREPMKTLEEREEFMGNPLNALPLLRRLNQDWPKWLNYLRSDMATKTTSAMETKLKLAPSNEDLQVALKGFARIESFYDQEAADMAKGYLLGQQFDSQLTAPDCFALAEFHYNQTKFSRGTPWYRMALRLHQSAEGKLYQKVLGLKRKRIYQKFAKSLVMEAFSLSIPTEINPEWETLANEMVTEHKFPSIKSALDEYLEGDEEILRQESAEHKPKPTRLERGCRGWWPRQSSAQLTCSYNRENSAFLRLAPLKMEVLNEQPLIVLYHEVLYEKELKSVREMANKSDSMHKQSIKPQHEDRVAKLHIAEPFALSINQRIADMTGLELQGNTALHMSNYGLGGDFNAHEDSVDLANLVNAISSTERVDTVLATVLLFASDVQLGGANVFPKLKISVAPKKGNALIWHNLNNAGKPEKLTSHAVCPVVLGSRWTIYKWIKAEQQMLKRPCLA